MSILTWLFGEGMSTSPKTSRDPSTPTETIKPRQLIVIGILQRAERQKIQTQRIQKYAFLVDQSLGEKLSLYQWKTYDYGPYSKRLHRDLERLTTKDLVEKITKQTYGGSTRTYYRHTQNGTQTLTDAIDGDENLSEVMDAIETVVDEQKNVPISNIIRTVIKENPEYQSNIYVQ